MSTAADQTHGLDRQRPLMWAMGTVSCWLRLMVRNHFAISPSFVRAAMVNTVASSVVSVLTFLDDMKYGRLVARTPLQGDPLFILGHWRSGTTFLQNLLALDDQLTFPTNLECFSPGHFLLTGDFILRHLPARAPRPRAFDNVPDGPLTPQEDEFALCMLGLPSPLLDSGFPNRPPPCPEYLDLEGLSPRALKAWTTGLKRFLQRITLRRPRRLVLKSPQHTARVKVLSRLFPEARFVHIVRNPYTVFASTMRMYRTMFLATSFQKPPYTKLEESVFTTYQRMFQRLEEGRRRVDPSRFYELRYEDLVSDPLGQVRTIYERLNLPGFAELQPKLEKHLAQQGHYQTNRYEMAPERRAEITRRWGDVIRRYGYSEES